jgi:alginate O-acetyltransferase complex protein AlgI
VMHGLALTIEHGWLRSQAYARMSGLRAYRAIAWIATFHFVCLAWIFFRSSSLDDAVQFLSGIWIDNGAQATAPWIVAPLLLAGAATHLMPEPTRRLLGAGFDRQDPLAQIAMGFGAFYVILVMAPASSAPFIYFRF